MFSFTAGLHFNVIINNCIVRANLYFYKMEHITMINPRFKNPGILKSKVKIKNI